MIADDTMPPPDAEAPLGKAWRVDVAAATKALAIDPAENTMVGAWVIEARWAHPVWHSYSLSLIHLRPVPDLPPAVIYRPGATHEFLLFALDPHYPRAAQLDRERARWLHPANFAAQLVEPDDEAALAVIDGIVGRIITGHLNPDTDARRQWIAAFGDHMIRTA